MSVELRNFWIKGFVLSRVHGRYRRLTRGVKRNPSVYTYKKIVVNSRISVFLFCFQDI